METKASPETLREWAAEYAETVDIDVDLSDVDWEISHRAKRRAGACLYDAATGDITVRLSWDAFEANGWAACRRTIRHELVHAWQFQQFGVADHGQRFREKAAELDAPRHCQAFADARLRLVCSDCDWSADRHRAARTVTDPERYGCGACGSAYAVEHVATGERWQTTGEYEAARERIGERW